MKSENRSKAAQRYEMTESTLALEQKKQRENFKNSLKLYYKALKESEKFKNKEHLTKEDILRVANTFGNTDSHIGNVITKFWGNRLTVTELNQVLERDGFYE